jgi:DDE family transposase
MIAVTSLPLCVTIVFRGMPGVWHHRHRLGLCGLMVMQALFPGRKTWEELARWTPGSITVWRLRRVLTAAYGDVHLLVAWWVAEALQTLPPPKDGTLHLVGDGRVKPKRGTQNPLAQKGRKSEPQPWFFGIRFALLIATGDVYRLPVAFRVIRRQTDPAYQTENALFREMVRQFVPPAWATRVIVEGDAAYGSQDTMKMGMQRDADDPARRWGLVCALARTWKTVEDKAIKDLVTHLPRQYSQRLRVPRLPGTTGCKTFWVSSTRLCLRPSGDVTGVLRKRGRNVGPKYTKILVTNLDEGIPRQVVRAYQRRWPVEQINRALKTDLGWGVHQGSREEGRIEQALGMAVLAYLLLIRACHEEMLPGTSWSIAQLQHALRFRIITNQVEHNVKTRRPKVRKVA